MVSHHQNLTYSAVYFWAPSCHQVNSNQACDNHSTPTNLGALEYKLQEENGDKE